MNVRHDPRASFVEATSGLLNDLQRQSVEEFNVGVDKEYPRRFAEWLEAAKSLSLPSNELRKLERAKKFFEAEYAAHPEMVARELKLRSKHILNILNSVEVFRLDKVGDVKVMEQELKTAL